MAYETILYEVDGPVLTITLNRPEKLNELDRALKLPGCWTYDRY